MQDISYPRAHLLSLIYGELYSIGVVSIDMTPQIGSSHTTQRLTPTHICLTQTDLSLRKVKQLNQTRVLYALVLADGSF